MIGKIVITFCIEKSSTLKNNIFLFRIYYLSMEAHELFLNTQNVYIMLTFCGRVIIFYMFYKIVTISDYYDSIWIKEILKKAPIYSEKAVKSKSSKLNVNVKKFNLHLQGFINNTFYTNRVISSILLLHVKKRLQFFVRSLRDLITALLRPGTEEINFWM